MDTHRHNLLAGLRSPTAITLTALIITAAYLAVVTYAPGNPPEAMAAVPELSAANDHCLTEISTAAETTAYQRTTVPYDIPDIPLTAMDGHATTAAQALGHTGPVMLNFIFTTCRTICPVLSATFAQVETLLGQEAKRIRFVSITIDPEEDTPNILRRYARKYHADGNWTFFTGRREDIVDLQRAFDIYRGNKMSHRPVTFLRAQNSGPWLRLEGFPTAKDLAQEYRTLLRTASSTEASG